MVQGWGRVPIADPKYPTVPNVGCTVLGCTEKARFAYVVGLQCLGEAGLGFSS